MTVYTSSLFAHLKDEIRKVSTQKKIRICVQLFHFMHQANQSVFPTASSSPIIRRKTCKDFIKLVFGNTDGFCFLLNFVSDSQPGTQILFPSRN